MSEDSYDNAKHQMLGYMQGTMAMVANELEFIKSIVHKNGQHQALDYLEREDVAEKVESLRQRVEQENAHVEKTLKESYEETMNALKI